MAKTDLERNLIDDSIALGRARTKGTAVDLAQKMLADGQNERDVLEKLWAAAYSKGFGDGQSDAMGD